MLSVSANGGSLEVPAFIAPGQAEDTISVNLGYGHTWGSVANEVGFNTYAIRPYGNWFAAAQISKGGGSHELISTQDYGRMKPPSLIFDYPERPIGKTPTGSRSTGLRPPSGPTFSSSTSGCWVST